MIDKYTYINYNMLLLAACAIKLWVIVVVAVEEEEAMLFNRQSAAPAIVISPDLQKNAKNVNGAY